jgi:hypothetical protein
MPKFNSNAVVVPGDGDPCPRCGVPMRIFEHRAADSGWLPWARCINAYQSSDFVKVPAGIWSDN